MIGLVAFGTFADGLTSYDQLLNAEPVGGGVDLFHSLCGAVMF